MYAARVVNSAVTERGNLRSHNPFVMTKIPGPKRSQFSVVVERIHAPRVSTHRSTVAPP